MTSFCRNVLKSSNFLKNIVNKKQFDSLRCVSYRGSQFLEDIGEVKVKYKVTADPIDWKYVERTLPPLLVPQPIKKESYPSGWKPQSENLNEQPYFIERTKNHMLPIYLKISQRGIRRDTIIKKIHGDIFLLDKELMEFLRTESTKPIRKQVHEFAGFIRISGDFVNACKYWCEKKGY